MAYFPIFIEMKQKKCLVVGGGKVAARKIKTLLAYEAEIIVVAPKICQEIRSYAEQAKEIVLKEREVQLKDCDAMFFVIAATNDFKLNKKIKAYCDERNIFVNSIHGEELCSVLFPAVIKRGDISIGITTGGKSPALSKVIREQIEENLPFYFGQLNDILGWARGIIKNEIGEEAKRREIFSKLIEEGIENEKLWTEEEILEIIRKEKE